MNAKDSLQLAKPFSSKKNQKTKMAEFQASTLGGGEEHLGTDDLDLTPHLVHKEIVDMGHSPHPKARTCCENVCRSAQDQDLFWNASHPHPILFFLYATVLESSIAPLDSLSTLFRPPLCPRKLAYRAPSMGCLVLCPLAGLNHQGARRESRRQKASEERVSISWLPPCADQD